MRRVLGIVAVTAAVAGFFALTGAAGDGPDGDVYKVELDNAFGITVGGDLKIAGVRAGKVLDLELDQRTRRAIVEFSVTEDGFGSLREDATCSVQPQSLIGEYYVDCEPGKARTRLKRGATIPVEQTSGTIPPDLVANIMRRPYRERLSLIVAELGAGVAGNGANLNAALRRANPALRETNKVLALLARQNQVLADLARDADTVVGDLAINRTDVSRFVREARDTARASAERDDELAAGFRRLPTFLRELEPTMRQLGTTADEQGPALRNLAASAEDLERLLRNIPPFAKATRPAVDALSATARTGREAVGRATPTVRELDTYSRGVPELAKNLAIILEHLDDRRNAAEEDPRSPGGKGYTGLEALLQYVYDQALATNVHDGNVHILKALPFEGQCAQYADVAAARELWNDCSTGLGPNAIGVNFPDATAPPGYDGRDRSSPTDRVESLPIPARRTGPRPERRRDERRREERRPDPATQVSTPGRGGDAPKPSAPKLPSVPGVELPKLDEVVPPVPPTPAAPVPGEATEAQEELLDYLLGGER